MPRRKPQNVEEVKAQGMEARESPQSLASTPAGGEQEQRQEPLYYKVTLVLRIDADEEDAKELVEKLRNLEHLEFALNDIAGFSRRVDEVISKAMRKYQFEKVMKLITDAEMELKEAKRDIFRKLADLGEIESVDVSEEW